MLIDVKIEYLSLDHTHQFVRYVADISAKCRGFARRVAVAQLEKVVEEFSNFIQHWEAGV